MPLRRGECAACTECAPPSRQVPSPRRADAPSPGFGGAVPRGPRPAAQALRGRGRRCTKPPPLEPVRHVDTIGDASVARRRQHTRPSGDRRAVGEGSAVRGHRRARRSCRRAPHRHQTRGLSRSMSQTRGGSAAAQSRRCRGRSLGCSRSPAWRRGPRLRREGRVRLCGARCRGSCVQDADLRGAPVRTSRCQRFGGCLHRIHRQVHLK